MLIRSSIVLIFAFSLIACTSGAPINFNADMVERLYFGRSIRDGGTVTDSSWATFMQQSITPRFPNGFTVWEAEGQWQGSEKAIVREQTFVVEIIHPADSVDVGTAIKQIIDEYKRRYRQESVLHVITPAKADY
ncbi:MAG: DUF3574 domain-containing protein [Anaerolineales bacterium]|nr:DUF3574 domain-containing protein [Anaerolineales bacterium]